MNKSIEHFLEQGKYKDALKKLQTLPDSHEKILYRLELLNKLGEEKQLYSFITELSDSRSLQGMDSQSKEIITLACRIYEMYLQVMHNKLDNAKILFSSISNHIGKLEDSSEIQIKRLLGLYYHVSGNLGVHNGNLTEALVCFKRAKEIRKQVGPPEDIAGTINNIGVIQRRQGDLYNALETYKEALTIFEKLGKEKDIAIIRNNVALIHSNRGELTSALQFHQQNKIFHESMCNKYKLSRTLLNMGDILRGMGQLDKSRHVLEQSLSLRKEVGNERDRFSTRFQLARTLIEMQLLEEANDCLVKMERYCLQTDNKLDWVKYRLVKAILLKNQPRLTHKMEAQELFEAILDEEVIDITYTFLSMMHLVDLLLFELMVFENQDILSEVFDLVNMLELHSKQTNSSLHQIYSLLLKSKLALLEPDLEKAEKLLTKGKSLSQKYHLKLLEGRVDEELENYRQEIKKWIKLSEKQVSIKEKIEQSKITDYLKDVKQIFESEN